MQEIQNAQMMKNDTIDLKELFKTLKKRKKMILLITLVMTLLAIFYAYFIAKPVYQVQAMIEVGKLGDKPLANIQDIQHKLEYVYGVRSKKKRTLPRVKAISVAKKTKSVFSVAVEGYSNDDAIKFTEGIVHKVEKEYKDQIDTYIHTQKELIALTQDDIEVAKENLKKIQQTLENYNQKIMNITTADAALAGIYTIQTSQNQTQAQTLHVRISTLKEKIFNLKLAITPLRIKRTQIVGNIEVLNKPTKPKKALIVIVSFITALILSIFLAFLLEFLRGLKEEE